MTTAPINAPQQDGRNAVGIESSALFGWLREKLSSAEKSLAAREQAAECWRGGTAQQWRDVGNTMTKKQRLALAEKEERIAARCRLDVQNYRAVIAALPNTTTSQPAPSDS